MAQGPFDAVFVDFYGTVAAGDRAAVELACRRIVHDLGLTLTPPEFAVRWGEVFFQFLEGSNHHSFRTLHQCELDSLQATLRPMIGEVDPVPYVAPLEKYWREPFLHEDALSFLAQVDVPTCCVSNADTDALLTALARHELRFGAVVTSQDVRSYKPDPLIFETALEKMGVAPNRVLHVGDSMHSDIAGASNLGITTAWICREDRIHDIGNCPADHTIHSMVDLLPILEGASLVEPA